MMYLKGTSNKMKKEKIQCTKVMMRMMIMTITDCNDDIMIRKFKLNNVRETKGMVK